MRVYVAVCKGRHSDPDVTVHRTRDEAITYARKYMFDNASEPGATDEMDDGEYWRMDYAYGSDSAYVVKAELKEETR